MRSNPITLVGIALIILGIVAFAYQGITYTSREKIIDIGPIQATASTSYVSLYPAILRKPHEESTRAKQSPGQ